MSNPHKSWFSNVSPSPGHLYKNHLYCQRCALDAADSGADVDEKHIREPVPSFDADYPIHCSAQNFCLNSIELPTGTKIGATLDATITPVGLANVAYFVASHLLYGSNDQKAIGRLWLHLCTEKFGRPPLMLLSPSIPKRITSHRDVKALTKTGANLSPNLFTDLSFLYGGATSPSATHLWRIGISDVGKLESLATVALPLSESTERSLKDMLREAVDSSAWE